MLCDAGLLSLHESKMSCVPALGFWVVATAMVCGPSDRLRVCGACIAGWLSTVNSNPEGLVCMVTFGCEVKLAVTVCGAFIVTEVEGFPVLATFPLQLAK